MTRVQWGSVCYYVGDVFWREHRTAGWLAEPALIWYCIVACVKDIERGL